jgi:hypothetical protein
MAAAARRRRLPQDDPGDFTEQTSPSSTTKRRAFYRIAAPRLRNAVDAMDLLALCADSDRYDFNKQDIEYIRSKLQVAFDNTMRKFERGDPRPDIRFPGQEEFNGPA